MVQEVLEQVDLELIVHFQFAEQRLIQLRWELVELVVQLEVIQGQMVLIQFFQQFQVLEVVVLEMDTVFHKVFQVDQEDQVEEVGVLIQLQQHKVLEDWVTLDHIHHQKEILGVMLEQQVELEDQEEDQVLLE
tara:strand:- start:183 stop:581 length:399 start_codon:yes stop_codon:yes gene_type:complete